MAFSVFQLLYMTLAIDKMDGHSLSNTARHKLLPRRLNFSNMVLPTEGIPDSSYKMKHLSYKDEWANAWRHI